MNLLIVNESQGHNLGDQAIHLGMENLFNSDKRITISKLQLSFAKKVISSAKFESPVTKIIKRFSFFYGFLLIARVLCMNLKRFRYVRNKIVNSDLVLIGGGSLLIDNNFVFPINLYYITFLCKFYKVPYAIAGVSSRKVTNIIALYLLRKIVGGSEFVYVRDVKSQNICKSQFNIEAKYVPDFALCLDRNIFTQEATRPSLSNKINSSCYDKNSSQVDFGGNREVDYSIQRIAINVMGKQTHGFFSIDTNNDLYIDFIERLITHSSPHEIMLFTTGETSDIPTMNRLKQLALDNYGINIAISAPDNLDALFSIYHENDVVFATRLHSAIIGFALGKKVACFNWDSKVEGFVDSLCLKEALVNNTYKFNDCLLSSRRLSKNYFEEFSFLMEDILSYA